MKPSTVEWVKKAEGDWEIAQRAYRARKNPVYDAACFHCQQCAEKYLKARLNEAGIAFAKTHDLPSLLIADGSCLQLPSADSAKRSPYFKRQLSARVADFSCRQLKSAVKRLKVRSPTR